LRSRSILREQPVGLALMCIDVVGAAGNAFQTLVGRKSSAYGGLQTALHWAIKLGKERRHRSIVGAYGPLDALVPIGNVVNKAKLLFAPTRRQ